MFEWYEAFWSVTHESVLANNMPGSTVHRAQHANHHFRSLAITFAATQPWLSNAIMSYNSVESNRMRFMNQPGQTMHVKPASN